MIDNSNNSKRNSNSNSNSISNSNSTYSSTRLERVYVDRYLGCSTLFV